MNKVKHLSETLHNIMILDSLTYAHKGGRVSSAVAMVGNILNIKPVISFKDGEVILLGKIRGRKMIIKWVQNYIAKSGIDLRDRRVGINHIGYSEIAEKLKNILIDEYGVKDFIFGSVGSVMGTYSGPAAIGIYF